MMNQTVSEYLTVPEAADLLRVSVSTMRRWVREGNLAAHRVGQRRVLLKRSDVLASIRTVENQARRGDPDRSPIAHTSYARGDDPGQDPESFDLGALASLIEHSPDRPRHRRLTDEEVEQAMKALKRAEETSAQLSARHGGKFFPPSEDIIREMREERTRQLLGEDDPDRASAT